MKKIVIYFSASGVTAKRAKELASVTGSDVKGHRTGTVLFAG